MKKILVLFCIASFFIACNTDHTEINYTTAYIPKVMDTLCFAKGSYWIYQNETDSTTDSVFVTQTLRSTYRVDLVGGIGVIREYYKMMLKGTKSADQILWVEDTRMIGNPTGIIAYAEGPILYSADTLHDWVFSQHYFHDSLTAGPFTWKKVQQTRGGDGSWCYACNGIGMVRKTRDDKYWNLIRYDLIYTKK